MITPKFSCTQNESSVTISLYVPSASEVEIDVDGTQFSVHINPYFLRLNFSGNVVEDDDSHARYDPSTGYLTVKLSKETRGEYFGDLDLLAKLLAPRSSSVAEETDGPLSEGEPKGGVYHPTIEVIGGSDDPAEELAAATENMTLDEERRVLLEAEQAGWHYPQSVPSDQPELSTSINKPYGFLDAYSGYFKHVGHTSNEVNELGEDAERLTMAERKKRREAHESQKWDEEYYLADFVNDEEIQEIIRWESPYASGTGVDFTEEENAAMLRLPRKEYLVSPTQSRTLELTLIGVLFAFAYDLRTTLGDPTTESAWTIASLCPAFSALDVSPFSDMRSTLVTSYRRALAFPLYRNWKLCERCREDVGDILKGGVRGVTLTHKVRHYHRIGTSAMYHWLGAYMEITASDDRLGKLSTEIANITPPKTSIGWALEELEDAAQGLEPDSDDEAED
ncbi:hypothetical protein FRC00_002108 [Tulasnella sp. 408]|nr:hypothetical protein FRC00_002108 [Tulasnella sp. 408]